MKSVCALLIGIATLYFSSAAFAQLSGPPSFWSLPQDVQLSGFNWNSSYWPSLTGGLNHRRAGCARKMDCLSPAEKMDLITNDQFHLSKWLKKERRHTWIVHQFWTGYCDSVSALQMAWRDLDLKPVEYQGDGFSFTLYPADIIAIAAYAIHVGKYEMIHEELLGNRCKSSRPNIFKSKAGCHDLSALAFHRLLTEQIANDKPWAADLSQYARVNNAVIQGYKMESRPLENALHREVTATLRFYHSTFKQMPDIYRTELREKSYRYRVELTPTGTVLKAEWVGKSQPDFFWRYELTNFTDEFSFLNLYFLKD